MLPDFFSTYKIVAVSFGSRVIAQLPREHRLVKNGSFDARFIECTYFYSDSATPCIWMFSIAFKSKFKCKVQVLSFLIPFQRPFMSYVQHANNAERNV